MQKMARLKLPSATGGGGAGSASKALSQEKAQNQVKIEEGWREIEPNLQEIFTPCFDTISDGHQVSRVFTFQHQVSYLIAYYFHVLF